jgi:hypothetical protein
MIAHYTLAEVVYSTFAEAAYYTIAEVADYTLAVEEYTTCTLVEKEYST